MADSWLESRKKGKIRRLIVIGIAVAVVVILFLQNNFGLFSFLQPKPETAATFSLGPDDSTVSRDPAPVPLAEQAHGEPHPTISGSAEELKPEAEVPQSKAHKPAKASAAAAAAVEPQPALPASRAAVVSTAQDSVLIQDIGCRLAGADGQMLNVSLKLLVGETRLRDEALLKREEIRVIVQKIFSSKVLAEVQISDLRRELKREINRLLDSGKINDLEFLDFKPMEM